MNVLIAGASGFIGRALVPALRAQGHLVRQLVRTGSSSPEAVPWNPARQELTPEALTGVDAIINLAGENVGDGRWTTARRQRILGSRVDTTRTLVQTIKRLRHDPSVFINASAVGIYGDRGDELLTESSAPGSGFLTDVCRAWEAETWPLNEGGVRTVVLRFGVVLGPDGGALAKMLPVFRLGLGGRLGNGRQWMSWITSEDVVGVIATALINAEYSGVMNVVTAEPVTNGQFTAELGRVLRRPTPLPVPGWGLRLAFGAMADETLLSSTRVVPQRLQELGYVFRRPHLAEALSFAPR